MVNSKHKMIMKTKKGYLSPEIEVYYVAIEQGIATSPNMEKIETVREEQDW